MAWEENLTVSELLKKCNYIYPLIIVRVNDEIIKKEAYDRTRIPDGADVKAIHLSTGG
jgi:sulfur carrier protein